MPKASELWTDTDIALLNKLIAEGASCTQAAHELGRSPSATYNKIARLQGRYFKRGGKWVITDPKHPPRPQILADVELLKAAIPADTRTPSQIMMGDPITGCKALEQAPKAVEISTSGIAYVTKLSSRDGPERTLRQSNVMKINLPAIRVPGERIVA